MLMVIRLPIYMYNGIKNWKELSRNIKECKRKDVFKTLVKQHLLDKRLSKKIKTNTLFALSKLFFKTVTCLFYFTESCAIGVKLHFINMLYLCIIISHYL